MVSFIFMVGGLFVGFILGIEYWKRKSILGYQNSYEDGMKDSR